MSHFHKDGPKLPESLPSGFNDETMREDSVSYDENMGFVFNGEKSPDFDDTYSQRQKLLVDEEDVLRNLAMTMRNPNINNFNILDTIEEKRMFNTKKERFNHFQK